MCEAWPLAMLKVKHLVQCKRNVADKNNTRGNFDLLTGALDFIETFNWKNRIEANSTHTPSEYVSPCVFICKIVQNDKNYVNFVLIYRCDARS